MNLATFEYKKTNVCQAKRLYFGMICLILLDLQMSYQQAIQNHSLI